MIATNELSATLSLLDLHATTHSPTTMSMRGVFAAVPTPFTHDGATLDLAKVKPLVDRLIDANVTGIVVTGTTGEFAMLTLEEHKAVIKAYVDAVGDRPLNVIAGYGACSTKGAVDMAKWCASTQGIDGIMVVPPFYEPLSFEGVQKFLKTISEACGTLDIVYYHLPSATGVHLNAAELRKLAEIPQVRYLKDTSGNATAAIDHVCNAEANAATSGGKRLVHFNGSDTFTFAALALGAEGVIWGVASIAPYESVALYQALVEEEDLKKAKEVWNKVLFPLAHLLESVNYPAGVKAALQVLGMGVGPVREPNEGLEEGQLMKLKEIVGRVKK